MPIRIQRKRTKGWAKPVFAVCVTRPSQFGNPFKVGEPAAFRFTNSGEFRATTALRAIPDAEHAVAFFRGWINSHHGKDMRTAAKEWLRGKDLACWCPLDQPCHADVLLQLANSPQNA